MAETGCLAWICTKTVGVKTRYAAVTPRGNELVEPEVATSPYPGKSRVPVCCGFDSMKLVGERGLALPRLFDLESNRSAIPDEPHAGRRPGSGLPKSCQMVSPNRLVRWRELQSTRKARRF